MHDSCNFQELCRPEHHSEPEEVPFPAGRDCLTANHGWRVTNAFWKMNMCGAEQDGLLASVLSKALVPV